MMWILGISAVLNLVLVILLVGAACFQTELIRKHNHEIQLEKEELTKNLEITKYEAVRLARNKLYSKHLDSINNLLEQAKKDYYSVDAE